MELQYIKYHTNEAGDIIFRQGDSGSEFYIILNGAVDVLIKEADSDKVHRVQPRCWYHQSLWQCSILHAFRGFQLDSVLCMTALCACNGTCSSVWGEHRCSGSTAAVGALHEAALG